jgi:Mg/Co/Ni transporter MgtE
MAKLARDVMTTNPACCTPETPLDQVAKLMVQHDCGEIPVIDRAEHVVGVITDRDIVTRVIARDKNPMAYTAPSGSTRRSPTCSRRWKSTRSGACRWSTKRAAAPG